MERANIGYLRMRRGSSQGGHFFKKRSSRRTPTSFHPYQLYPGGNETELGREKCCPTPKTSKSK